MAALFIDHRAAMITAATGTPMRGQIPFTDYDFWAYLSAGFLLFVAVDQAFTIGWVFGREWKIAEGLFVVTCAYAAGHIIAGLSSAIIERRLVRKWLGAPVELLMHNGKISRTAKALYPSYFEPLPQGTRNAISAKAAAAGAQGGGEALFWCAFTVAKKNPVALGRINNFLNQYGMCRNLSMALALGALILLIQAWRLGSRENLVWGLTAASMSGGMLLRYLKFYRHHCIEVLTTFAYEP